jgi:hypothetical protein
MAYLYLYVRKTVAVGISVEDGSSIDGDEMEVVSRVQEVMGADSGVIKVSDIRPVFIPNNSRYVVFRRI